MSSYDPIIPSNFGRVHCDQNDTAVSGVTRALIGGGGGGVYSYIRVLPDGFLLKLSSFMNIHPPPPPPISALVTPLTAVLH